MIVCQVHKVIGHQMIGHQMIGHQMIGREMIGREMIVCQGPREQRAALDPV
jgi:hypothetical protein